MLIYNNVTTFLSDTCRQVGQTEGVANQ